MLGKLLKALSRRSESAADAGSPQPVWLEGSGRFDFEVVGESNYQDALSRLCGGPTEDGVNFECTARLICEPHNPYDPNAVAVRIGGETIAYLSRGAALAYQKRMRQLGLRDREVSCRAIVVGGWARPRRGQPAETGHFGVKLDLD
jgi:hypothetical protein